MAWKSLRKEFIFFIIIFANLFILKTVASCSNVQDLKIQHVEFSNLVIEPRTIPPDSNVTVRFDIENDGNQSGTSIFQIWVQAPQSKLMQDWNPGYREGPSQMQRSIVIEAGGEMTFSITVNGHFNGTHMVTVRYLDEDLLQGSFKVVEVSKINVNESSSIPLEGDVFTYLKYPLVMMSVSLTGILVFFKLMKK